MRKACVWICLCFACACSDDDAGRAATSSKRPDAAAESTLKPELQRAPKAGLPSELRPPR